MKCNLCGTENVEGTRYCKNCGTSMMPQEPTPVNNSNNLGNGIACMVLGIVSVVFGCTPIVGLVCGIIAIVMNRKDLELGIQSGYHKAGFVCGIIGVCFGAIALIYWLIWLSAVACVSSATYHRL